MERFIFDLQRFDSTINLTKGGSSTFTITSDSVSTSESITATTNDIVVSLASANSVTTGAAVSLESINNKFHIANDTGNYSYELKEKGKNGIVVSIGSGSSIIIDSIDNGDAFIINDKYFSQNSLGFFAGSFNNNNPKSDKVIIGNSASTVALNGTNPAESSKWHKIVEVDDNELKITSASLFGSSSYAGVVAADTDSQKFYAQLSQYDVKGERYKISKSASLTGSLSSIVLASDVLKGGVAFEGFTDSFPSITTDSTTFQVNKASGTFVLTNKNGNPFLDWHADQISLISGALTTASKNQTISAGKYTISSYNSNSENNDGIIISYTKNNGEEELSISDWEVGESFSIIGGSGADSISESYTRTAAGLVNSNGKLLLDRDDSVKTFKESTIAISDLIDKAIDSLEPFDASSGIISLSGGSKGSTLITYGNDATATLTNDSLNYTLSTNETLPSRLNLGGWQGISLGSSVSISLSNAFVSLDEGVSPLKIFTRMNGEDAVLGITKTLYDSVGGAALTSNDGSYSLTTANVQNASLISGTFLATTNKQNFTLAGSNNLEVTTNGSAVTLSVGENYASMKSSGGAKFSVGRGSLPTGSTIQTDKFGNTHTGRSNVLINPGSDDEDEAKAPTIFAYDKKYVELIYGKTTGISVTDLDDGESFSLTSADFKVNDSTSSTRVYVMEGNILASSLSGSTSDFKVWIVDGNSNIKKSDIIDLNKSNFQSYIRSSSLGSISLPANASLLSSLDPERIIVGYSWDDKISKLKTDFSKTYGKVSLIADNHYRLTKDDNDTDDLSDVFIADNATVEFDENFSSASITVFDKSGNGGKSLSSFKATAEEGFTVSYSNYNSIPQVTSSDSSKVTLIGGSLLSNDTAQTIYAGTYSISSKIDEENTNGIIVGTSVTGSNKNKSTITVVGGIDNGEFFYIDGKEYNRGKLGITWTSVSADGTESISYYHTGSLISGSKNDFDNPFVVDIANLNTAMSIIAASELVSIDGEEKRVLEIGTKNKENRAIVDSIPSPTKIQAALTAVGNGTYSLQTVSGYNDSLTADIVSLTADIVSLTGGITSINSALVSGKTIVAAGSDAAFVVTNASNGSFAVSGRSERPTISGAKALTLYNGTIAASKQQTVTIGEPRGKNFIPTNSDDNNIIISYSKSDSVATINALNKDGFSLNGKTYSIKGGNGMDVVVDSSDVTLSNLSSKDNDVFVYGNETYSLRAVGLVGKSGKYLWDYNGDHSLSGDSVAISNLGNNDNWNYLQPVTNYIATVTAGGVSNLTFTDKEEYIKTYGSLKKITDGEVYSLSKTGDEGLLTAVNIKNSVNGLYLSSDYKKMSIKAQTGGTEVSVTGIADGIGSYLVTLYSGDESGVMGLSGVTNASLKSGSLKVSDTALNVSVNGNVIRAGDSTTLTLTSDSILGLSVDESFIVNGGSYTLSAIGITNAKNQLLQESDPASPGDHNGIAIRTITSGAAHWRNLISPDNNVLTIENKDSLDNVLIVNDKSSPTIRYATLTRSNVNGYTGFTMSLDKATVWPDSEIIKLDNVAIEFNNSKSNKGFLNGTTIEGAKSGAIFTITDSTLPSFTVIDSKDGASIGSAQNVNLLGGTVSTGASLPSITVGKDKISYFDGDGIKVIANSSTTSLASIGGLNKDDIFTVGGKKYTMASNQKLRTGNLLWRGKIQNSVVAVSALDTTENSDNWRTAVSVSGGVLELKTASILGYDENALVIDNANVDQVYGTITKTGSGYSLSRQDASNDYLDSIKIYKSDNLSLTSAFKGTQIIADGAATFSATSLTGSTFSVNYDGEFVTAENAPAISLTEGTIKVSSDAQTVTVGGYAIHGISFVEDTITIIKNGDTVKVGNLEPGEKFAIGNNSYEVVNFSVIKTTPNSTVKTIADDGDGWNDSGVFSVGTGFSREIITVDENKELNLSTQNKGAIVVDNFDNPTVSLAALNTLASNAFRLTDVTSNSIASIYLGNRNNISLDTDFDTTVRTDAGNHIFTINDGVYRAAGAALTIQSGMKVNESSIPSHLINGAVLLNSTYKAVQTSTNKIAADGGNGITVTADGTSPVTLSGLNKNDKFTVDDYTSYSLMGAGLLKNENKIWTPAISPDSVVIDNSEGGLNNSDNWDYYIAAANGKFTIPPTDAKNADEWIILSENLNSRYGTLKVSGNGYSIAKTDEDTAWGSETILIGGVSVTLPADFRYKNIEGAKSGAMFTVRDNTAFSVFDTSSGAIISGATDISQTGGTISLTDSLQTISFKDSASSVHSVKFKEDGNGNGITVIINENSGAASIGALSLTDIQDSFIVDGVTYTMLDNGSILREDNRYWTASTIRDNGALSVDSLLTESYWGSYIKIDGVLNITKDILGEDYTAFVAHKDKATKIYGTLSKSGIDGSYTLDGATAVEDAVLTKIILSTEAQPVNFSSKYGGVEIEAGDTSFKATNSSSGFSISYTDENLSTNANSVSLLSGAWTLTDTKQTLYADGQTLQAGGTSTKISVDYNGSNEVNITGIDKAGEIIKVNGTTYQLNSTDDNGITLNIKDSVSTVNKITNEDNFTIADNTFIKKDAGFVRTNSKNNSFLWINSADVEDGAAVASLNGNDTVNTWAAVATINNNNIVIDRTSSTAILINDVNNLQNIYGALTVDDSGYSLSNKKGNVTANTETDLITVDNVIASIGSDFANVAINAKGASFAITSSQNQFYVDAKTGRNAVVGNASEVSLVSGTLAELTSATTVKTENHTIAAQGKSTLNVNLSNSIITVSDLDSVDSFKLNNNDFAYREELGVVKDNKTLYVNSSLKGSVTSTALENTDNFQTMFGAGNGATLNLQPVTEGIFVDSADSLVSVIYAKQTYGTNDDGKKVYTFTPVADNDYTIDAASLNSGGIVYAKFDSQVITPGTGTFTVNDKVYKAASVLTIDTNKNSSELNSGKVSLSSGDFVDMAGVDNDISVTGGEINVNVANGSYTLGGLNKNDVFTIGNYNYTLKSDNYIVRADKSGTEEIYLPQVNDTLSSAVFDSDAWNAFVTLDNRYALNLDSTTSAENAIVISSRFDEVFASITASGNDFDLRKIADAATDSISAINIAANDSTLTTDFAATVKTAEGSKTYTVNDSPYTANDSELTILAKADKTSAITKGTIKLNDSPSITAYVNNQTYTISGTVEKLDVANMKFTPEENDNFTLNSVSYEMTGVGLTKNDSYLWTRENVATYTLPADDNSWSNMMRLTRTDALDLINNQPASGSTVILDNGATKRMATLTRTDNTYTFKSAGDGNSIATIQLGDATETLTVTTDFNSDVTTRNGIYKINGNTYKGNALTIKADDSSSALYSGTVSLAADDYVIPENGFNVTGTSGTITAAATNGTLTSLGNLDDGDAFTIDNDYYKVLGSQTLVKTDANGNPSKLYQDSILSGSINYADIVETNFVDFIQLGSDSSLDLTTRLSISDDSKVVVVENNDPTSRVAEITYSDDGYKLETTSGGNTSKLSSVKLGAAVPVFSTSLDTTVKTTGTTPFTINTKSFTAQSNSDLTIAVSDNTIAVLTEGTVILNEGSEVTTRRTSNGVQIEEVISATSGAITVDVSNNVVTIGGLAAGEKFTVDGTEYTMTSIGLLNDNSLNANITDSVVTTDLSGENWQTIFPISNSTLDLTANTLSNNAKVWAVDISNVRNEIKYGTLEKNGNIYTLTQSTSDTAFEQINITGTTAILGTKAAGVKITTGTGATFSVTNTSGTFTVNALSSNNPPVITDADSVDLTEGTIQATANIPITANGKTITATSGSMTVTRDGDTVTIEDLDINETFTVDGANYKVTTSGKLFDMTDANNPLEVTAGFENKIFTIDAAQTMRIIAVVNEELDLTNQSTEAYVYNNLTDPIIRLATFTFEGGQKKLTDSGDAASAIKTVDIGANTNNILVIDFATKVHSPEGTVIVNTKRYAGTTELIIDVDGSTDNSTLYNGTITLDSTNPSATDTKNKTVQRGSGSFTATAENGEFKTINGIENGESFIYGDRTYRQSAPGLLDTTDTTNWVIRTDILADATISLVNLRNSDWKNFRAPENGILDLSDVEEYNLIYIYDDANEPTTKIGEYTFANDGTKTLTGESNAASVITTVKIGAGDNLAVNFVTDINSPEGTVTVNGKSYAGTTELEIRSVIPAEGDPTSAIYSGTITLDYTNPSATDTESNTLTREKGTISATATNGRFTEIGDLDSEESFTYNGVTYTQSEQGLRNGALIRPDLRPELINTTLELARLNDAAWSNLLAPNSNGVLDISTYTDKAFVYDSETNPTIHLADLQYEDGKKTLTDVTNAASAITTVKLGAGDNLAVNFVTDINSPEGTVTVNGKSYVGTTDLVIHSDGEISTLTKGTVSLAELNSSVATTIGRTITYTADIEDEDTSGGENNSEANSDGGGENNSEANSDENISEANSDDSDENNSEVNSDGSDENISEVNSDGNDEVNIQVNNETNNRVKGITVAATSDGTVTIGGLDSGDTFTVDSISYRVSVVGPVNSNGELWNGSSFTNGITLDDLDNADNWTTMLLVTNDILTINDGTLTDGDKFILTDNISDPTQVYGDLSKANGNYTLKKPSAATTEFAGINASGIILEIDSGYKNIPLVANNSAFSEITLNDETSNFTLDTTGDIPTLSDNVKSLTLSAGTIKAAVNQSVTTGENTITPTAINGNMIIGTETISGIVEGDAFTIGEKTYKMTPIGLVNDTDKKLATGGIEEGILTIADLTETQLIAVSPAGALDLSKALSGNSIVTDSTDNPANIYGRLNKNEETYTLNKENDSDGIKAVTMPDADSVLTTDIAAPISTPSSSHTFTVNRRDYKASDSALEIASDGTTSTLTDGKISLVNRNDTVTTTSGSVITYTTEDGDSMTVEARLNSSTLIGGLTSGDTFKIGDDTYRVTDLGFHNNNNYLWTSTDDFKRGVAISDSGTDGINNSANWTKTVAADDGNFTLRANTLGDGETAIIIDSETNATKTFGTLTKTSDGYTLTKNTDDDKPASIAVNDTKLTLSKDYADVPTTADGATFTVTTDISYTVDATGNIVSISDDATGIEISKGTINATTRQTVTATSDSGNTKVIAQNNGTFNVGGEEFIVSNNVDDITFSMTNGVPNAVSGFEEGATATIDGITYTSPKDDSTLKYNDVDGWYFDGYIPTSNKYNITVDGNGNVLVDSGVRFTDVVASGKTLPADGIIKLAADVNSVAVNVTNNGSTPIAINDKDNNPLVENLGRVSNVTFDNAGVMVERTSDVAGAVFTFDIGKSLETETATITSNATGCEVGIGSNGTSISIDKSAEINAPANTILTLGNANYTVNDVDFSTSGTAQASITSGGVKVDLVISDAITYDETKFDGTGTAKADIDKNGGVSLTSGASVDGAAGKAFNLSGTITLDANTIEAATSTDVTAKANGIAVGNDDVTVTGDDNGYKVNIVEGAITGIENIGGANGVTLGGLANGTIKTDKVGAFTVADRTFTAIGDSAVTYGIENGKIIYANDVDSILSGDFADGLDVNGGEIKVTGENVSLRADTDADRELMGLRNNATLTTAEGVTKVEPIGAGKFTFGEHIFETNDQTVAFNLLNSSVKGIDSLENGTLVISQDENNFGINDKNLTLTDINSPVTLNIADSHINSVLGFNGGGITGLDNAVVSKLTTATINGKFIDITDTIASVMVVEGEVPSISGLNSGATVKSAPNIKARTTGNGSFVFRDDKYNINDTLDGVVVFETNINSYVTNIGEFEGSISGNLEDIKLNDKEFNSSSDKVTVANDGTDIIGLYGLSSGDSISGSLSNATYLVPEGTLTVNDQIFILRGDDNGVSVSGDGKIVLGLDKDASLTVAKGGDFSVNSIIFDNAKDGTTFIAGRDGVYIYDPNNKPISERTPDEDIIRDIIGAPDPGTISLGGDSAASLIASGSLDGSMALTLDNSTGSSVQTADFSNSSGTKRVTLLGGDQDVKFNDDGRNAAHVVRDATGRKNIELGDGGDVAVNDSPYARVSIKTGKGEDTIVNRNDAKTTVDVGENGDAIIIPTSGRVTLQNYDDKNNARIRNFDYTDIGGAIKSNEIKFGDGIMTLGDAVVVFDPDASEKGGTWANLVDYSGNEHRVGFTHTDGGVLNASTSGDDLIMKGNYAESSSDTKKSGASTLIGGRGDDTIFAGAEDYVRAGAGDNQIYVTDKNLRGTEGATIVLGDKGRNTIHNFNDGFDSGDVIQVNDVSALRFTYGTEDGEGLVMRSGSAQITFDSLEPAEDLVTFDDSETASPYEIKLTDGKNEYNAAIAQEDSNIGVSDNTNANIFYGNRNGGSGIDFSEYSGSVEVNLNLAAGRLTGEDVFLYNINKIQAGDGDSTLIGKFGENNTLLAGTGNGSMWGGAGRDLMVGNTSDEKDGSTMFYFMAGDGRDTIDGFNYMADANDYNADIISLPAGNIVTDVFMQGEDIVMQINESRDDYLRLQGAVGKDFKLNDRIARVDNQGNFDNLADFYVVADRNATMKVGADIGNAQVWLDDKLTGEHGIIYKGEIKYLDASAATGNSTLVGNELDNVIYGGAGSNSIWGGYGANNDTLIGGSGHNIFFFGLENGADTITSINAGDVVYLANGIEQIASTTITSGATKIELIDGSSVEIQGNAKDVEYQLADGSKYTADHDSGQWNKK